MAGEASPGGAATTDDGKGPTTEAGPFLTNAVGGSVRGGRGDWI